MTPTDDLIAAVGCWGVGFFPGVMATGGVEMAGIGRFLVLLLMTGREEGGRGWMKEGGCDSDTVGGG